MQDNSLQILLAFDQWATARVIAACDKLNSGQFQGRFDIGPGSLHDAVTHILGAMRTWTQTLAGQEPSQRLEADGIMRTPGELMALHEQISLEFQKEAERRPVNEHGDRKLRDGRIIRLTRCDILTHVTTHGMHHRAQCLNMLRQLGVKPLPASSVVEWSLHK